MLAVPFFDSSGNQIKVGSMSLVDGFTILGPFAVRIDDGKPTIANCKIQGGARNLGIVGAVELLNADSAILKDCDISDSGIGVLVGGRGHGIPTISHCNITGNDIGILQDPNAARLKVTSSHITKQTNQTIDLESDADFQDTVIEDNRVGAPAGFIVAINRDAQRVTLDHCTIRNNRTGPFHGSGSASFAGGVFVETTAPIIAVTPPVVIRNSEITGNVSAGSAGGIHIGGSAQLINDRITGNTAAFDGGGVFTESIDASLRTQVVNTLIAGNHAQADGGGLHANGVGPDVVNTTIAGNSASRGGAAFVTAPFGFTSDIARFANCALTGNTAAVATAVFYQSQVATTPPPSFKSCAYLATDTFFSTDPFAPLPLPTTNGSFAVADAGYVNAGTGDYRLAPDSPLIDQGNDAEITPFIQTGVTTDLDGQPRIVGVAVDIGAFEFQAQASIDVTSQVLVTPGGFRYNRSTGRFVQSVVLENIGTTVIAASVSLVLDSLSASATLFDRTGVTAAEAPLGSPYLNVSGSDLAPGASVSAILDFADPTKQVITYTPRVLAGPGTR